MKKLYKIICINLGQDMRVLFIENDINMHRSIESKLTKEGFKVFTTELGEDGIGFSRYYDYDLIILDLELPDINGIEVLKKIRSKNINTPILVISELSNTDNKVKILKEGADDYLIKPIDNIELIARIHALIRRSRGYANSVIKIGNLSINLMTKMIEIDNNPVHFTKKEYSTLELLSLRKNTLVTKEMFLNHLYGGLYEPGAKIIDVMICKLRKKIAKQAKQENIIITDWGRGYILRDNNLEASNTSS